MTDNKLQTRPGLVVVSNCITPYRVNLHRLYVKAIPELELHTLITHGVAQFDWDVASPEEINVVDFSLSGESPLDNPLKRPVAEYRKLKKLEKYLRQHDARALIFNGYQYLSYLGLMDYCYRHGIPFFVRSDSNIRCDPPHSALKRFAKQTIYSWWIKRASGVMPMYRLGDEFFAKYGADPSKFYRVPWWPDYDACAACDRQALEQFRKKYGLDPARKRLLYSGRFVPEKRVDLLLEAFGSLVKIRPDWDLMIAGKGPLEEDLRRRVPADLSNRVLWLGFLDHDEPRLVFHAANTLVVPSDMEPAPVVLQEAMAAGLPVVASDVCGSGNEIITDRISGRLFKKGDLGSLKESLEDMTHPANLARYTEQARIAFAAWRERDNPIPEVRRALRDVGAFSRLSPESDAA